MEVLNIIESLVAVDQQWLVAINGGHAPWADTLMWYISKSTTWLPLYAVLVGLIVWRYGVQAYRGNKQIRESGNIQQLCGANERTANSMIGWDDKKNRTWCVVNCLLIFVAFAVAVGGADYISSGIIKHAVCRPRPTHEPALEGMLHIVRGYTGGMYGFVSSHAANTMACALLFSLIWRNKTATCGLMLWVAANCYSRMYLGVHYPLDIAGGLIVGSLVAVAVYLLLRRAEDKCRRAMAQNG